MSRACLLTKTEGNYECKNGVELLRSKQVKPQKKKFEICDTDLKGFTLTIHPDVIKSDGSIIPGGKIYGVRYRLPGGKQGRKTIGRHASYTPAQARDKAKEILDEVKKNGLAPAKEQKSAINHTFQVIS